jgi:hypothetical protein
MITQPENMFKPQPSGDEEYLRITKIYEIRGVRRTQFLHEDSIA